MALDEGYLAIAGRLGLDVGKDGEAARVLAGVVGDCDWSVLTNLFREKPVGVFGCGPSLGPDLDEFIHHRLEGKIVSVAADGAVRAFLERGLVPDVNVTDLDGDADSIVEANRKGAITVVHGHGNNINLVKEIVPKLSGRVLATTQHEATSRVRNMGGFTDGDRACHMVEKYNPCFIALFGMDFGQEVGEYSGSYNIENKVLKLAIGEKLVEDLAGTSGVDFYNITSSGADIENVENISLGRLQTLIM